MNLKKIIKEPYDKASAGYKWMQEVKQIKKLIRSSKDPIPELTDQQKEEIKAYWKKFGIDVPLQWHQYYYGKTGIVDPSFIPGPVFHNIIKPCMNTGVFAEVWGDKSYIDFFLRGAKTVRSVVRNVSGRFLNERFELIDIREAQCIMEQYELLVIKPATNTHTGHGVQLLKRPYDLRSLHKEYRKNYVIQLPLRQHPELAKLNVSSVNTIRVNSVLLETKARVMSAFIKVGQPGEFADNKGSDRYFIGVNPDGVLNDYVINRGLQKFEVIPSGYVFAGRSIPNYEKVCAAIEEAHTALAHFGFVFWDVSIDENGEPVIVEANLRNPDTIVPQVALGPFFGKYTDEIMEYIQNLKKY